MLIDELIQFCDNNLVIRSVSGSVVEKALLSNRKAKIKIRNNLRLE